MLLDKNKGNLDDFKQNEISSLDGTLDTKNAVFVKGLLLEYKGISQSVKKTKSVFISTFAGSREIAKCSSVSLGDIKRIEVTSSVTINVLNSAQEYCSLSRKRKRISSTGRTSSPTLKLTCRSRSANREW